VTGLLLINLGTPSEPTPGAVRRYLRQFLGDPRVLDMSRAGRWFLLNFVILPFRPKKSAEAYRKIWGERGSPLLANSRELAAAVQARLGPDWAVELGMRYGEPSIEAALARLRGARVDRVVALPLYPQYASSSTGSSIEELWRVAGEGPVVPPVEVRGAFFDHPAFIRAFAAVGAPVVAAEAPDHVLFSFHGLPERHMRAADATGQHCLASPACCAAMVPANRDCYRAQCYATARTLAAKLGLAEGIWSVAFQSRLTAGWIEPYTDKVILQLAAHGVKRVVVFCPAFVADCLETLEEIGLRAAEDFKKAGGEKLTLVPSLNATPDWVEAVAQLAEFP
jgi:ferrochelatase